MARKKNLGEKYEDYKRQYQKRLQSGEPVSGMMSYDKFLETVNLSRDKYKDLLKHATLESDKALYRNKLKNLTRSVIERQFGRRETTSKRIEMVQNVYDNRFDFTDEEIKAIYDDPKKSQAYAKFVLDISENGVTKKNVLSLMSLLHIFVDDPETYWY